MARTDTLFKYLESRKPKTILDVGNLAYDAEIHKKIIKSFPESKIFGLDIQGQEELGLNFDNQVQGNITDSAFDDGMFDFIYIGEVIEHVWEPKKIMDESRRLLEKNGVLVFDTPNTYALHRMIRYLFRGRDYILGEPDHKFFFSVAMLENLVEKSGFEMLELTTDRKFTFKGKTIYLPSFGSFKTMGSHLVCVCKKE